MIVLTIAQPIAEASEMPLESQPLALHQLLEDLNSSSDEEDEIQEQHYNPRTPSPPMSQSSSPLAPSPNPSYEIILQEGGKDVMPPPLHLALGLWCEKSGCSRTDYVRLREVLQLQKPSATEQDADSTREDEILDLLPLKLDTLKRQIRRHIPLLRLMRKPLTVVIEKQPSLPQGQKGERQRIERTAWQYWYDPVDLIKTILSAAFLRRKMHFGMAQYVDEPTELWESQAWGSSIRTTSGEVCYTKAGSLIIPGDTVRLHAASYNLGRVIFIGRDYRTGGSGNIVITLQAITRRQSILKQFELNLGDEQELFLLEDVILELSPDNIDRHVAIYLDRESDGIDELGHPNDDGKYIRRFLNLQFFNVRPLRYMQQTRAELEVTHFGRKRLQAFVTKPHISLPYLLFVDDFGVHRNMYRALKAFYLIPACLDYQERRKLANVFTLSLGPHGAKIEEVVEAFSKPIRILDSGVDLEINGNMEAVWSFAMSFLGDMPQQADNAGFMRHTAKMGCRTCRCPKEERGNLDYDIRVNGRYHEETLQQRQHAGELNASERKAFVQDTGIRLISPPIAKLAPALDLIQSRPYDAPHSEWRGLGRILQGFLMTTILSKRGSTAYLKAFQQFPFPPGWKRIQSPAYYIWSWSLSESGKATLLAPLILRSKATIGWFRLPFLQAAERVMNSTSTPLQAIVRAFGLIARSNTLVGSQRYTEPSILHEHILDARRAYQELITCATPAAGGFRNDDDENDDDSEDADALNEVLSEAARSDSGSGSEMEEVQHVPKPTTAKGKGKGKAKAKGKARKPRGTKFEKLLRLPNVHAGLHLADNAREYATVMNSNVLAGELKHKLATRFQITAVANDHSGCSKAWQTQRLRQT